MTRAGGQDGRGAFGWRNRRRPVRLDGAGKSGLRIGRDRLRVVTGLFALAFVALAVRLVEVSLFAAPAPPRLAGASAALAGAAAPSRADIIDRNGAVLATSLATRSLYADPSLIRDPAATAARLSAVLPALGAARLRAKLASKRRFVWIKRQLIPRQVVAVNNLGEPGLAFLAEERRVYPHGPLAAHVVGYAGIDNRGLAGIERAFDARLLGSPARPLQLSLDLRLQHALRAELLRAVDEFHPIGAAGLVLDVFTAEILAMVSLPDFDPNAPGRSDKRALFNRASLAAYEMGSTFKTFTTAMALEVGAATLGDRFDARRPLRLARYTIRDFHGKHRWLSVPEIFVYSSNVGAARMALAVGGERQRWFLARLGLLSPATIELPEVATPLVPEVWREVNTATVGFGHGIAVSPVQLANGVAAVVNGGLWRPATLLKRDADAIPAGKRVISADTSRIMRQLMRLVVMQGTGAKANVPGYQVGGKTGTAEKIGPHGYDRRRLLSSFAGIFPSPRPRYLVLVVLDEPKGTAETHGYATGGWTAAPVVARVIARIGPISGIAPAPAPAAGTTAALVDLAGDEIRLAAY